MTGMVVTPGELSALMDFDHVIRVHPDGTVSEPDGIYAPGLYDDEMDTADARWKLMDGYSGQDRYSGPIMHESEFIGGRMAADVLANPGLYVALVGYWTPEDEDDEDNLEGWAIAHLPENDRYDLWPMPRYDYQAATWECPDGCPFAFHSPADVEAHIGWHRAEDVREALPGKGYGLTAAEAEAIGTFRLRRHQAIDRLLDQ